MSKTTSISQIKKMTDLIDLYANKDLNADGKISTEEYGKDVSSFDMNDDGLLSPWEIMANLSDIFNEPSILWTKELNRRGRAFEEFINNLESDTEIGGVVYKAGTALCFCENGRVCWGTLAKKTKFSSISHIWLPPGSVVTYSYDGNSPHYFFLGDDIKLDNVFFPKGTRLDMRDDKIYSAKNDKRDIVFNGMRFKSLYLEEGMARGTLSEDVKSPYGSGQVHRADSTVRLSKKGDLFEDSINCFRSLFPNIKLSGLFDAKSIGHIIPCLDQLPPLLLESIKRIELDYKKHSKSDEVNCSSDENAHVDYETQTIHLWKERIDYYDFIDFIHEAAHLRHHQLRSGGSDFEKRWKGISSGENPYGKYVEPVKCEELVNSNRRQVCNEHGTISVKWLTKDSNGETVGSRYGFVSPYGAKNLQEDIATCTEMVYKDPLGYKMLINSNSSFYREYPEQRQYARVYREKLKLLYVYGFITPDQFNNVLWG